MKTNNDQIRYTLGILLLLCFGIQFPSNGQLTILPSYSSSSIFYKSSLWSFAVINGSAQDKAVQLRIVLGNENGTETILKVEANQLKLRPGINGNLEWSAMNKHYEYGSSNNANHFEKNNYLPSGSYSVCIFIYEEGVQTAHVCQPIRTTNFVSLNLLSPPNHQMLNTLLPVLQWNCFGLNAPTYNLIVTKLYPFTSAEEAIYRNERILDIQTHDLNYNYKFSDRVLEYNVPYAWRVIAMENNEVQATSDSWVFTIPEKEKYDIAPQSYRMIYRGLNTGQYLYNNVIKIAYRNSHNYHNLNYEIVDVSGNKTIEKLPVIALVPGINKIDLNIKSIEGLKKGKVYYFIIQGKNKGDIYKLKFEVN